MLYNNHTYLVLRTAADVDAERAVGQQLLDVVGPDAAGDERVARRRRTQQLPREWLSGAAATRVEQCRAAG